VLAPPDGLTAETLASALARGWGLTVAGLDYRPVGFGSHHWVVVDGGGGRWFATVDDLEAKRHSRHEAPAAALDRLRASLATARALRDHGRAFVVAPVSTRDGEPLVRVDNRFAAALYPFVEGESFAWGEFAGADHRQALLDLVIAVHTAPDAARRRALPDDFVIPHRDEVEAALDPAAGVAPCGPYAEPAATLLRQNAAPIRRLLARYDAQVVAARAQASRAVLTHGEPHPGNTMSTTAGWLLIDWETARIAPPERDLWHLDPGDGSILAAYAEATGVPPLPSMIELYRLRWDLADLAMEAYRFRRHHAGGPDDEKAWQILRSLVAHLARSGTDRRGDD
jgi:spectinomycin phosphotransferase/16S rRNA (guanine(1405)-N(7))-methyltransferase